MTRVLKILTPLFALLLALTGVAAAQTFDLSPVLADPVGWAVAMTTNPLLLGLFVFGVVATVKRDAERRKPPITWNPWLWRGIAFAVGVVASVLLRVIVVRVLNRAGVTLDLGVTLLNGLAAGVIAVIGRDGLKTALGWLGRDDLLGQLLGSAADPAPAAQPLAGLPVQVGSVTDLIVLVLEQMGLTPTQDRLVRIAAALVPVAPDFFDGDLHLSSDNRNLVLRVAMEQKTAGRL
ncbi:hypothetical protein IHN32_00315 [Deinococcus sp. 14RED07]|uniref:hypothetical protein n=1 Tax=unclassified Deinococcus TaxID=2623546 RepID=UPI001E5BB6C0|nr:MULTISPECIES: hypothetical protein [unclassified Deinococcus]MCD0164867.1 hypothetical protein [Deinococcus sp. 12RED42]MCD0174400.1 hypothetical protein [Deinococcus sp. 14RED07]